MVWMGCRASHLVDGASADKLGRFGGGRCN